MSSWACRSSDQAEFQRRSDTMLDVSVTPEQQAQNTREMNAYMESLVQRHRRQPGEDILGMLIREHANDLTTKSWSGSETSCWLPVMRRREHHWVGHLCCCCGIRSSSPWFATHPEVTRSAVEEIVRYLTIVDSGNPRIVLKDMTIGGQPHAGRRRSDGVAAIHQP